MMLTSYSGSGDTTTPPRSRQKPGSACDECRRRKLRCDRERPRCGVCSESGVACNTTPINPPRGPKRGHLKALHTRIGKCQTNCAHHLALPLTLDIFQTFSNIVSLSGRVHGPFLETTAAPPRILLHMEFLPTSNLRPRPVHLIRTLIPARTMNTHEHHRVYRTRQPIHWIHVAARPNAKC